MSKQNVRKPLSIALGAALVTSLGAAGVANAETDENLFSMEELTSGYLIAGAHGGEKDEGEGNPPLHRQRGCLQPDRQMLPEYGNRSTEQ